MLKKLSLLSSVLVFCACSSSTEEKITKQITNACEYVSMDRKICSCLSKEIVKKFTEDELKIIGMNSIELQKHPQEFNRIQEKIMYLMNDQSLIEKCIK
ncbi:hypothetical protein [Campylobacter armoricus]|uniref:Lipoprotein n=1 Tax=Campylobacter armoricus TaxID=2505970 RepID=A0A7L5IJV5_9BACT|nr:hypothetical protein [Campylobacter armoricus]QKF79297.1 hypothetical protein CARM_0342 [Campylobacter armoricus]